LQNSISRFGTFTVRGTFYTLLRMPQTQIVHPTMSVSRTFHAHLKRGEPCIPPHCVWV